MTAASELDAAGINGAALRASYLRCRRINAEHGKTFYLATLLLPPAKRPFVHALYGFARHVDDIVDDLSPSLRAEERAERLQEWSADFLADLDWGDTSDPVSRAVIDTVQRWAIPTSYFADFLDSMRMDLAVRSYRSYDDLVPYMWGSAAVIGLETMPRRAGTCWNRTRSTSAWPSSSPTSSAMWARICGAAACTCPRSRCSSSASTATGSQEASSTSRSETCSPGRSSVLDGCTRKRRRASSWCTPPRATAYAPRSSCTRASSTRSSVPTTTCSVSG
jgi:hypothetical protein